MTDEERFWAKVHPEPNTGCWLWAANQSCGYGRIYVGGKPQYWAHRVAWEYVRGPIPKGQRVIHRCLMRACVNPSHLFLGTKQDVQDNTFRKGTDRRSRGVDHYHALLNDMQVLEIRRLWADGARNCDLARQFSASPQTVYGIVHGRTWKHLPCTERKVSAKSYATSSPLGSTMF